MIVHMLAALSQSTQPQVPVWFPLVMIVGMWLLISVLLGFICGHVMLLGRFPPVTAPEEQQFPFASGSMRGVSFRSALHVGISARGLHLAPNWLFRPLTHRGIPCIPWAELRCTSPQAQQRWWFTRASRFEIPRVGLRFMIGGKAGLAIEAAVERRRSAGQGSPA
jgi:hypothetical protein